MPRVYRKKKVKRAKRAKTKKKKKKGGAIIGAAIWPGWGWLLPF